MRNPTRKQRKIGAAIATPPGRSRRGRSHLAVVLLGLHRHDPKLRKQLGHRLGRVV